MSEQGSSGTFQRRRAPRPRLDSNAAKDSPAPSTTDGGPFANIVRLQAAVGNRAVSRMLETSARSKPQPATSKKTVQRLWPGFTWIPESGGTDKRKKVLPVDQALTAFHKTNPNDFKARKQAAEALEGECTTYLARRFRSDARRQGVKTLMAQAAAEIDLYGQLIPTEGMEYSARMSALLDINDNAAAYRSKLSHLASASPEIKAQVGELIKKHDAASPEVLAKIFAQEVAHLREIVDDPTAPKIVKEIVAENLQHVDKIHFRAVEDEASNASGPGAREAKKDEGTGGKKYVVNHQLIQTGGAAERTGSLVHELSHVATGEAFGHAPLFVIFKKGKQDTEDGRKEIIALAISRKANADQLEALVNDSDALSDTQKGLVLDKIGYGKQAKLGKYLTTFKEMLGGAQSPSYIGLSQLANHPQIKEFDSTLVEYDSVINQIVLYFHEWNVPADEPAYKLARDLATDAKAYRDSQGA